MNRDLDERLFNFTVQIFKYLKSLNNSQEICVIKYQLAKSSSSVTANYEEAQAASSRMDFKHKINISLKEIRETNFWLRLLKEIENKNIENLEKLILESIELKKILGSICSKLSKK
jgi:four helix bundle protein